MRVVGLLLKLAGLTAACIALGGCFFWMGETPPQWVAFEIDFPGKTKDEAFEIATSIIQQRNYKPQGEWRVQGKDVFNYRPGCGSSPECRREFEGKREWREYPPRRTDNDIRYSLGLPNREREMLGPVTVSAADIKGGARMSISLSGGMFAVPLSAEQRAEIVALKPILDERFGAAAVKTSYSRGACAMFSSEPNCQFPFWSQSPAGQTPSQTY